MARGTIVIDRERCKGCLLCTAACVKKLIALGENLNDDGYLPVKLNEAAGEDGCTGCCLCALVCPDLAIEVFREETPKAEDAG